MASLSLLLKPNAYTSFASMIYSLLSSFIIKVSTILPSVKISGLIPDSRLSCEPHLQQLQLKCEKTQYVRSFSKSSWGRDWAVLLHLYCAQICLEIYCSSFIYISVSKSNLSILDSIHSARIQLATGAFCPSCLTSIYIELGALLLSFWRDLLLSSHAPRLVAHLHHLS